MLEHVFGDACRIQGVSHDSQDASEIALRILALFNAGMVDELDLRGAIVFLHMPEGIEAA